jgi:hypothetical protein
MTDPIPINIKEQLADAYAQGLQQGKRVEREWCALLVEHLGAQGYGTLAIAAAIRERMTPDGNEAM